MNSRFAGGALGALLIAFVVWAGLIAGCSRRAEISRATDASSERTLYACGMHPWIIQDHPGNCPICGMKLEPVHKTAGAAGSSEVASFTLDPATLRTMDIQTAAIVRGPLRWTIRTVATIDYDEAALADVTTKYRGWVEQLHVAAAGALVKQGEPLFEIYSPELYSAQAAYLGVLEAKAGPPSSDDRALLESARSRLKFYDISDAQIAELEKTGLARRALTIGAPIGGFVIEKNINAGQMVDPGTKLYRLADIGVVWVYALVYEQDLPYVRLGQQATVKLPALPDREFRGRVTYVYPNMEGKTQTVRVRMEFHNPGFLLKPGMFGTVDLAADLAPSALLVPDSAVLRGGRENTVFVALPGGRFEARGVQLGLSGDDDTDQVLGGLDEGERVVTSGQFMLDSESQLREAIRKTSNSREWTGSAAAPPGGAAVGGAPEVKPSSDNIVWVCPMPEHVSITYDHPGDCPICGMRLVAVTRSVLEKIQPGGEVLYYTCPMPEHSDVRSDIPGKCPHCGMTLIPVMSAPSPGSESFMGMPSAEMDSTK